jgi:hypothetical protein
MGDKRSGRHFPEEDTSSSSSTSGTGRGQSRYKPLAPKGSLSGELQSLNLATFVPQLPISHANWTMSTDGSHAPHRLQGSRSGAGEATQQLQDLTFVNMTNPQQSKSHESRTLVRRQVMVNFAREKRRQPNASFPGGPQPGSNTSNTISGVQELFNAAMPTLGGGTMIDWSPEGSASGLDSPGRHDSDPPAQAAQAPTTSARSGLQRRKPTAQPSAARLPSSIVNSTSNSPGVVIAQWPVASDAHVQSLVNHCKIGSLCCSSPVFSHLNAYLT